MKIVVAPDSFKESLDAVKAAEAIQMGIKEVLPDSHLVLLPIADGGEGTTNALVRAGNGKFIDTPVSGPLGNTVLARWGVLADGTGVMEMAAASGLPLVPPEQRNPMLTSTLGTGQLLRAALDYGCTRIILGIGGSATNDGGAGVICALGAKLLDGEGREIEPNAKGLLDLAAMDISGVDSRLANTRIEIACDVNNPLLGPRGASRIYGPQKGADPAMVEVLEQALAKFANVAQGQFNKDIASFTGSGAAGGLAAGLSLIAPIQLRPGIELVLETIRFQEHLADADLAITAEGRIDAQSAMGKAVSGVANLAKAAGVPVLALCGTLGRDYQEVYREGVNAVIPILDAPMPLEHAMADTSRLLTEASARVMRIFLAGAGCQGACKNI